MTLKTALPIDAAVLIAEMENQPFVGVHFRLGDKALLLQHQRYAASPEYLRKGLSVIREESGAEKVLLFSDDPDYCKAFLAKELEAVVIDGSWNESIELQLFSKCRHHVISDSTFSWWGAWLGAKEDQIVVAPKTWGLDEPPIISASIPWRYL